MKVGWFSTDIRSLSLRAYFISALVQGLSHTSVTVVCDLFMMKLILLTLLHENSLLLWQPDEQKQIKKNPRIRKVFGDSVASLDMRTCSTTPSSQEWLQDRKGSPRFRP